MSAPQGQWGQQPPGGAAPGKSPSPGGKRPVLIGIGAVVLVAAVVVAVLLGRGGGIGGPSPSEQATQLATDYLTAISEGRAEDAAALVASTSIQDDSLLTSEVLADSLMRTPLTDIVVAEPIRNDSGSSFTVPVSYSLGGSPVTDELWISTSGDEPSITTGPGVLSLSDDLDVTVNGVSARTSNPQVFPGSYVLTMASEYLVFDGEPLLVTNSSDYASSYDRDLVVTEAGVALFREKVIAEAQACLESTALDPGCGAALPGSLSDGTLLRDGSITRTRDAEARAKLQSVTPRPGSSAPTVISARGSDLGSIDLDADCQAADSSWQRCELWGFGAGFSFGDPSINVDDPALAVEWD